ncbi:MAG: ABC transporter ATP-binding protein [Firmicutes bacterium]|nr:ABC transporter ATP-binding protein [Bacillota bacterium]
MEAPIAELKNVSKNYQAENVTVAALQNIDFRLNPGDMVAFVGPSGSGKTTMLNLLGCLDKATSGEVSVCQVNVAGADHNQLAELRNREIGFIFQSYNLIPVLTAFENVEFPLILQGVKDPRERRERVEAALAEVGIRELQDRRPSYMSGGQQQRVAIARALVKKPVFVLADEPTANLDSKTGEEILKIMRKMNEEKGVVFVFSTHDRMVMKYARRLVGLRDGEIVSDGGNGV